MVGKNNKSLFGFTLTELLIALTIIGAIAGLTIPSLLENLQKKMLITKLKSDMGAIQQLINDQLIYHKTKNLLETDFNDPAKLMVEKNFSIVKYCSKAADCWTKDNNGNTIIYKRLSDGTNANSRVIGENPDSPGKTVILKNGSILTYTTNDYSNSIIKNSGGDRAIGMFRVDVNGSEKPNIVGRDVFWFLVTKKGKIVDFYTAANQVYSESNAISKCKSAESISVCISVVMENNWTVPY